MQKSARKFLHVQGATHATLLQRCNVAQVRYPLRALQCATQCLRDCVAHCTGAGAQVAGILLFSARCIPNRVHQSVRDFLHVDVCTCRKSGQLHAYARAQELRRKCPEWIMDTAFASPLHREPRVALGHPWPNRMPAPRWRRGVVAALQTVGRATSSHATALGACGEAAPAGIEKPYARSALRYGSTEGGHGR